MKHLINIFFVMWAVCAVSGCKPETIMPEFSEQPITSISATIDVNGYTDVVFTGTVKEGSDRIEIEFPYFYPEDSDNLFPEDALKNAKVKAVLVNNAVIKDPIVRMDLTEENHITVIDQIKEEHEYIVTGKIVKSSACDILSFSLPDLSLNGVIMGNDISLVSVNDLTPAIASVTLSPHATISPDPRVEALDYNEPVELVVTAHDGVTSKTYTVSKSIPEKIPSGIREGSATVLFAKKIIEDLGLTDPHMTIGLGVSGNNVVLHTRGRNSLLIDKLSGSPVGELNLGSDLTASTLRNFYATSDDSGNMLYCNLTPNDGNVFKIWRYGKLASSPEEYISWDAGGNSYGRKISVTGSLDADAIITAPLLTGTTTVFARWTVSGGQLVSQTPELVTLSGLGGWTTNADLVYTEPDINSDYYVHAYTSNTLACVDGSTNTVVRALSQISTNYIPNAVDCIEFNGIQYVAAMQANPWNWGDADFAWLLDVSNADNFTGALDAVATGAAACPAVVYESFAEYGPKSFGGTDNSNGTSDIILDVSEDGFYLYMYFMFTNGYVVGIQFDCIDM